MSTGVVRLRDMEDADLDILFGHMSDPESVRMAAFTAKDPNDRAAFDEHMRKVSSVPDVLHRVVTCDGVVVGMAASFVVEGDAEVTYWIDRRHWGKGVATRALELLLELQTARPLYGRAASDNLGSLRVLAKAGFVPVGTDVGYANARGGEIEETILRLDA